MVTWLNEIFEVTDIEFEKLIKLYFLERNKRNFNDILDNQTIDKLISLIKDTIVVNDNRIIHLTYRDLFNKFLEVYKLPINNNVVEVLVSTEVYQMVLDIYSFKKY